MVVNEDNRVLVMFDILFDMDVGLINLIKNEYNNDDYFYSFLISDSEISFHAQHLYNRECPNPLEMYMREDKISIEEIDNLYSQFMIEKYDDIALLSYPTIMIDFIRKMINNDIDIYIGCKSPTCMNMIKYIFSDIPEDKYHFQMYKSLHELDISEFDTIILRSYYDVLLFNELSGHNIIISTSRYNMVNQHDTLVPNPEVSIKINDKAVIGTISMYPQNDIDVYLEMINNEE